MGDRLLRKGLVVGIIVLFVGSNFVSGLNIQLKSTTSPLSSDSGNTLYVGGTGEGNYTRIQDAIDNASDGDTVFVLDDSSPYYENVVVDKPINLFGENKDTTIIDGMKKSYAIEIKAHNVHIKGFTIKNGTGDPHPSGIYSYSLEGYPYENIHIEHNIITENQHGIYFVNTHKNNISNNIIKSNSYSGLHIYTSDNFVWQGNEITDNGNEGIFCVKTPNGDISYNMISGNSWAGLKISYECNYSLVSNNIVYNNGPTLYGIQLFMSSNVIIKNNYFSNIPIPGNPYWEIYIQLSCFNNLIYHNDVYEKPYDEEGASTWDDGYPSGGNYWEDYTGEDSDGDGIGDTLYLFQFGEDRYPFMEPYNDNWTPYARFSYLEDKYNVSFDASSSYDFHGNIVLYEWDFGDGTTSEGKTITHDYSEPGKYEVTLKVTDNNGTTDTTSWEVLLFPVLDLIPDLFCEGNLVWEGVKPGETIEDNLIVKNIGDPESLLDWEIIEYPIWGEWTFIPSGGEDLTPEEGPFSVQVSVIAPDVPNKKFTGTIKIVNSENPNDFCEIDILLKTPRNKALFNSLFYWFLEHFPILNRALNLI